MLLDARGVCSFADYFVICSGDSERQIQAIYDEIGHVLKREGILPHHHEGTVDSGGSSLTSVMLSFTSLPLLSGNTTNWISYGIGRAPWSGFNS